MQRLRELRAGKVLASLDVDDVVEALGESGPCLGRAIGPQRAKCGHDVGLGTRPGAVPGLKPQHLLLCYSDCAGRHRTFIQLKPPRHPALTERLPRPSHVPVWTQAPKTDPHSYCKDIDMRQWRTRLPPCCKQRPQLVSKVRNAPHRGALCQARPRWLDHRSIP